MVSPQTRRLTEEILLCAALILLLSGCRSTKPALRIDDSPEGFNAVVELLADCPVVKVRWRDSKVSTEQWNGYRWVGKEYESESVAPSSCKEFK